MLTIHLPNRIKDEWQSLPIVTRLGLAVMVFAGALDVVLHLATTPHFGHHFGGEHLAHVLGVVGMVLVLGGVVIDGVRRQRKRRAAADSEGEIHATR